jgi:hypothetical protein
MKRAAKIVLGVVAAALVACSGVVVWFLYQFNSLPH